MRLIDIQYTGDFRDALRMQAEGSLWTYGTQQYTVSTMLVLVSECEAATMVCCVGSESYDEVQGNLRMIGLGCTPEGLNLDQLIRVVESAQPTHVILRFPHRQFTQWLCQRGYRVFLLLADSFEYGRLPRKIKNWLLGRSFNNRNVEWVANHQVNAAHSLVNIGVHARKVLPYDFEHASSPANHAPKSHPGPKASWQACYVGQVTVDKGVGDAIDAIAILKSHGSDVRLKIAGNGTLDLFRQQAERLGVGDRVEFAGTIANVEVLRLMRESDFVYVLSHHNFPEGLPLTITEAYASRTPLVTSDHKMFRGSVTDGVSGLIVPAGSAARVAAATERLIGDPQLYESISAGTQAAFDALQIPLTWADMLRRWVHDQPEDRDWLRSFSVAHYKYRT